MWHQAFYIVKQAINRSGVSRQVEAERIISMGNKIGKDQFQAACFRDGVLTIKPVDADPVVLQAESIKIKNTINKALNKPQILKIRITSA